MYYFDNASTTAMYESVMKKMIEADKYAYGNPSSLHSAGFKALAAVNEAREQVASILNASSDEIIFTSGGSEANNLAFKGLMRELGNMGKTKILISAIEHDSIYRLVTEQSAKMGLKFDIIPVDEKCVVKTDILKSMLTDDVGLVSVMNVNNETGAIQPIKEISSMCHDKGILFHTDAVQALGTINVDVKDINCDFLSVSSHKIHGSKGVGALYAKDKSLLEPLIIGGHEQEYGLRGGTQNVTGIIGFGEACKITEYAMKISEQSFKNIRDIFLNRLLQDTSDEENFIKVNGNNGKILNISFEGVDAQTLLQMLSSKGVLASAGSACRSLENVPSRVLKAMGISDEDAYSAVRFSFDLNTQTSDITKAVDIIAECALRLRHSQKECNANG